MMRQLIIGFISMFISCYFSYSQENRFVDNWMDMVDEWDMEEEDYETLLNELSVLAGNPYDINRVTAEELAVIPFLSDIQIKNLIDYRQQYGDLVSLYELKNIDELDFQTIQWLLPFVYIDEKPVNNSFYDVNNLLKRGKNELIIRYDQCFQQKKGYKSLSDSILQLYPNRKYIGEPFYHSIRYSYSVDKKIQVGMVAEKDAGEAFWNEYNKGYDFYSFHALLKDYKQVKTLAIGDYKCSFGQGLVMSNDFSLSRSAMVSQVDKRQNGFRRHYSTNEIDFLRGAAITYRLSDFDINLFYSGRKLDANTDSCDIRSFKKDGLHRTINDLDKRKTVRMQTFGGNIRYASSDLVIGLTGLYYSFGNHICEPEPKPYNLYHFRGSSNLNIGVDYVWQRSGIKLFGETAFSKNGSVATLNGIQIRPVSYIHFSLLHRYYDKQYHAFYGKTFSQNSSIQNEQGVYMALQLTPFPYWKFTGYLDVVRYPWLKYQADAPTEGREGIIQVQYTFHEQFQIGLRYKNTFKERNGTNKNSERSMESLSNHRYRLQSVYGTTEWRMKSTVEYVHSVFMDKKNKGYLISQSVGYSPENRPVKADVYIGYFTIDDYGIRIQSGEKNILYAFSTPSFYGKGMRLSSVLQWKLLNNITLYGKLAFSRYLDRETIGTGLEEIDGNVKTDFYLQCKLTF